MSKTTIEPKANARCADEAATTESQTLRPYSKPELLSYGSIADLTHAGGSSGARDLISKTMM